ncbi:MAG: DUF2238 domain-containing protein [Saprospiraceae bacterium]|nr:DUF2238 domain-containing protein [Candidatus Vicinibacter affinis]
MTYLFICIYLCMHVYGSKYTYAENPLELLSSKIC